MTKMRGRLATVLATGAVTLIATIATIPTTQAATHPHPKHTIRYASLDRCKDADRPCGPWRLTLRDGREIVLPDAQVNPHNRHGKPDLERMASIAISGEGQRVAYIRTGDHRLVVRDLNGDVHVMPREALPTRADGVALRLSLDGTHLAVDNLIFDVNEAVKLASLPGKATFEGFSGDGDEVLTFRPRKHHRMELTSYTLRGELLARATLTSDYEPGSVTNTPYALGADGRLVAHLTTNAGKGAVEIIDLITGEVVRNVKVKVRDYPSAGPQQVFMADWITADELTVHLEEDLLRTPSPIRVLVINLTTGKIRTREDYKFRDSVFGYEACGG
jgi:hypothetical protein